MATIAQLIVDVQANTANIQRGMDQVNSKLDSVGSLAGEVGKGLVSAFTATAVIGGIQQMVSSSIQYADALTKMKSQTRLSVVELQQLEAIGRPASVSLDEMSRAALALNKNLDSKAGQEALRQMGYSLAEVRAMKPMELFTTMGQAVQSIHDPIDQANAKTALFGKTFDGVAAAFDQDVDSIVKNTKTLSDAQIQTLDEIGDMWDALKNRVSVGTKSWVADMGMRLMAYKNLYEYIKGSPTPTLDPPKPPTNLKPLFKGWMQDMDEIARVAKEQNEKIAEANKVRAKAEKDAAEEYAKAAAKVDASLERMRFGYFKLGQAAVAASQNISGFKIATGEFVTVSNDYSKTLMEAQIQTDAFGHVMTTNTSPAVLEMGNRIEKTGEQTKGFGQHLGELLSNTAKKMGEWQSDLTGKLTEMFGGKEGGVMGKIVGGGMNLIFGPATGLITSLMAQGMAKMAELAWTGLKKIGGFFKDLFGGPSAKELAGREVVEAFTKHLQTMMTDQQKIEAGTDEWKQAVIVVRDKYLELGLTEQQALDDVKAMWEAEKGGAAAAQAAVDRIAQALGRIPKPDAPWVDWPPPPEVPDYDGGKSDDNDTGSNARSGFAMGTGGRYIDFGPGTNVTLHGRERVMTEREGRAEARVGASAAGDGERTTTIELDGQVIARYVERYLDRRLRASTRLRAA